MLNPRIRLIGGGVAALVIIWVVALAGYKIAQNATVTPEKVRAYTEAVDLSRLTAADRAAAIQKLAALLNALSLEERQNLRLDQSAYKWFDKMTEAEKGQFLEATMPTGFKQMLTAFENLPPDKRRQVVAQAIGRTKTARERLASGGQLPPPGTNSVVLSAELQDKVTKLGLKSFYSQSSAQTKAEVAPLLEEMQRAMESGRMMHERRQP
jgi:predicted P-loop ATPase